MTTTKPKTPPPPKTPRSEDTAADDSAPAEPAATDAPSAVEGDAFEVAHFVAIQANPVEEVIIQTAQEIADADGDVNVTLFDANNDPQAQIAQCEDAIAPDSSTGSCSRRSPARP